MQWKRKAHEMDKMANELLKNPEKFQHMYIFGAGLIGEQLMLTINKYGILEGFIDNDLNKQREGYKGIRVYSLDEYLDKKNGFIIIAASEKNRPDIVKQLKNLNFFEKEDYVSYIEFRTIIFPILSLYLFNKLYIYLAQISLTERCSLKCKKCAHGCFAVDNKKSQDLTIEQVYKSADSFFNKVDFIDEFVLIGGEPLLYQQLADAIQYIGKHYRSQIGVFSITTNGTIIPSEDVLEQSLIYDVLFRISNYSLTIPRLKKNYKTLTDILKNKGIDFILSKEEKEWMDYGFEYVNRNATEDELIQVFDACKTPCREVRENKFYFCVMARSVSENMEFFVGEEDYLDLDNLVGEDGKKELLEFNLGYSKKGFLDMCNFCHGSDAVKYPIPVAEQVKT